MAPRCSGDDHPCRRGFALLKIIALSLALFAVSSSSAEAHRRHHARHRHEAVQAEPMFGFSWPSPSFHAAAGYLPHPSGCPRVAFCGCGAAQEVGRGGDRSLWLARSWFKFPRAAPAPGMAAVRSHHVFVLKEQVQGSVWIVADYNSGGHLSRVHTRSIAGYSIVNPGSGGSWL